MTFANTATADLKFGNPSLIVDPNSPPSTLLLLEFGKDGSSSPVDPGLQNTVSFTLKKDGVNALPPFQLNALPNGVTALNGAKRITMVQPNAQGGPGFYTLSIEHLQSFANAETWELAISGLPSGGSPVVRGNAALVGASASFSDLTPNGQCTSGTSCPSTCPAGQCCQSCFVVEPFPWWKYEAYVVDLHWPIPPNPCLSCPEPWNRRPGEEFERVIVSVTPFVRAGVPLGSGRAKEISMKIEGGEAIGGVVDAGRGQYMQMIQFRKGASPPRVSATAAGITSETMVASAGGAGVPSIYRTLTYLLLVLLIVALLYIASLSRRRGVTRG